MLAVKSVNVRDHFKEWCDKISMGETELNAGMGVERELIGDYDE